MEWYAAYSTASDILFFIVSMSENLVTYIKTLDSSGTFEIGLFWSRNIYCQYSIHSPSENDFILFFRRNYFLHILASFFRTCFENRRDGFKNVRKFSCDVSDIFVQFYSTVRYFDII